MHPLVSAVLLAAGMSRRMGRIKQLLPLGDKEIIRHCLDAIASAGVGDIVVVLSPHTFEVAHILPGLNLKVVSNDNPLSEMAESVRVGLRKVDRSATGVLVCLSDHPLVSPETIRTLLVLHQSDPEKIIVPAYKGRRGHPSLFPLRRIEAVFEGLTLREILSDAPDEVEYVDIEDQGIVLDLDTPEDYRRIRDIYEDQRAAQ